MFKKLREKIENVEASSPNKYSNGDNFSPAVNRRVNATGKSLENNLIRSDSLNSLTGSETEMPTDSSTREDLLKLLKTKSTHVKRLEVKLATCSQGLKDRNRECDKLASTLEKQQDTALRRLNKLNESFQEDKKKFESTNLKFESQEKENARLCDLIQEWEKQKEDFEAAKKEFFEKRDNNAELQDLQMQEMAKLKHMVMNSEKTNKTLQIDLDGKLAELLEISDKNKQLEVQLNKNMNCMEDLQKELFKEKEEKKSLLDLNKKSKTFLENMTDENTELQKQISELKSEQQKNRSSLTELEIINGKLHEKYDTLKHNNLTVINKANSDLGEKDNLIKHLESKVQTLEHRSTTEKLPQDEQVAALLAERKSLEEKGEELRQQLNNVKATWSEKINQLETQVSHLNLKIAEDSSEISEKNSSLEKLNEKFLILQEEFKSVDKNSKELTLSNKTYLQQINEMDSSLIQQQRDHEIGLKKLTEDLAKEHEAKLLKMKLFEKNYKEDLQLSHKREMDKIKKETTFLIKEKEELLNTAGQKITGFENEIKKVKEQFKSLQSENTELVSKLEEVSQELAAKKNNEKSLNSKQSDLETQVSNLQAELDKLKTEHNIILTSHRELNEKHELMKEDFSKRETGLKEEIENISEQKCESHLLEVDRIQTILDMRTNELMECKKEIALIKNNQTVNDESISELEQEKSKLENELLDKDRSAKLLLLKYNDLKKSLQKEMKRVQPINEESSKKDSQQPATSNEQIDPIFSLLSGNMSLDDPSLSGQQREVVVKYLKHVVLKFLSSSQSEAQPLIKAISAILNFSQDEENHVKDILNYKSSWFSSKPSMKQLNKTSLKNQNHFRK